MSVRSIERTTITPPGFVQRLANWLNGERGLQDYLHGSTDSDRLNSDTVQELSSFPSAEAFYHGTLEKLIGQTKRISTSAAGFYGNWNNRVSSVVRAWSGNDDDPDKLQKLKDLFDFFSGRTPLFYRGNVSLKLQKENYFEAKERIDTTALFASSFTPSEFAQFFLTIDENSINNYRLMNIIWAFDYNLCNRAVNIPPEVVKTARIKLQNIKQSRIRKEDREIKGYLANIAIGMQFDKLDDVDLDTCFDVFDHPYLEESMMNTVASKIRDLLVANHGIKNRLLEKMKQTPVTTSEQNFWNVFGGKLISLVLYSSLHNENGNKAEWRNYRDYLGVLVDKLIETENIDGVDVRSIVHIGSSLDTFLYAGSKDETSEVIEVAKSARLAKILLDTYYKIGKDFHPSTYSFLLHIVRDLLSQSDEHGRQAVTDPELNKAIKTIVLPYKKELDSYGNDEPLSYLNKLVS